MQEPIGDKKQCKNACQGNIRCVGVEKNKITKQLKTISHKRVNRMHTANVLYTMLINTDG